MAFNFSSFRFAESSSTATKVEMTLGLIKVLIPNSSTRESLKPEGYPEDGKIEQTIRAYQNKQLSLYEQGLKAMETGCGNCQEMAYASGLILRTGGFTGTVQVAEFGINHAFLIVEDYILDPWAETFFPFSAWKTNLKAYGGSIKEGVMKGRTLAPDHYELEDEEPEVVKTLPIEFELCLPSLESRAQLVLLLEQTLAKKQLNTEVQLDSNNPGSLANNI